MSNRNISTAAESTPVAAADLMEDFDHKFRAAIIAACGGFSPFSVYRAWLDWGVHLAASPGRGLALRVGALDAVARGAAALVDLKGRATASQAAADKRFRDEAWRRWPYSAWAENFLTWENWWDKATQGVHGADPHNLALVNFLARQALDAMAPTNFLQTNPVALEETLKQRGANLTRGLNYFWRDVASVLQGRRSPEALAWVPGKSVALTPGAVVRRTKLAEIIQYSPTTEKVRPEPVVIAPAWIMKYYILDLQPRDSLIKALTEAGFTVFAISWRNPTAENRDLGFESYATEGLAPAIEAALAITGASRVHLAGYCIGGALAAVTAAAMARDHDGRLASLTMLAAQVDYTEAGELTLFVDPSQVAAIDDMMWKPGVFEGARMAGAFDLLRSNDLIWSHIIHHYLMGRPETMTDIAAWSQDTTRLPAAMQLEYLREFYLNNDFAEGRFVFGGKPTSPRDIRVPVFALGTETDHVAPWKSVFKVHQFTDAEVTFALTSGGHNTGVVSPPGTPGRSYHLATASPAAVRPTPEDWLASSKKCEGSWWPAWFDWLAARSGEPVSPPPLGKPEAGLPALEPAPGQYVHG